MAWNQVGSHRTTIAPDGNGYMIVTYHQTQIVRWNYRIITLNSGGYKSNTTKRRLNQASAQYGLDYGVFQRNHQWFVDYGGQEYEFFDGMVLDRTDVKVVDRSPYVKPVRERKPKPEPVVISAPMPEPRKGTFDLRGASVTVELAQGESAMKRLF